MLRQQAMQTKILSPMSAHITRHLLIRGRVQGVGFRNYLEYKASQLGIGGWVRNRSDGSVETVAQGAPAAVEAFIECARRGPRASAVTGVTVSAGDGDAIHAGFGVRPTV